jgi:DNA-directed RNA polymerase alpha subunit
MIEYDDMCLRWRACDTVIPPDNTPINELDLSVRLTNSLCWAGYTTFGSAKSLSDDELLRLPNLGRRSLKEWRVFIRSRAPRPSHDFLATSG